MFLIYEFDVCVGEVDAVNYEEALRLAQEKFGYDDLAPIYLCKVTIPEKREVQV